MTEQATPTQSKNRLTDEYLAMTPAQKWDCLLVNGLIGTDEPWIEDMRSALKAQDARIASLEEADFQQRVTDWMLECFTPEIAADTLERADRFIEEALELAQTEPSFTAERAHALVDYVFNRPVGDPKQEVGGVMVTLAALCGPNRLDMMGCAELEYSRISRPEVIEKIRAKQAGKPTGSALPQALEAKQ